MAVYWLNNKKYPLSVFPSHFSSTLAENIMRLGKNVEVVMFNPKGLRKDSSECTTLCNKVMVDIADITGP